MKTNLIWDDSFSVHVKEIDDQHKELIKIIYELYENINKHSIKSKIGIVLDKLLDYCNYHFSTEEKYFKKFNYKNSEEHIKDHREFTSRMINYKNQYKEKEIEISLDLIEYLENWLLNHLLTSDHKYIICFQKNGLR